MVIIKYVVVTIFVLLEVAFFMKFTKAHKNFDITREVAIILIMLIVALVIFALMKV